MTSLIRCRGAVSEIAALFHAVPDAGLDWRPHSWPGEPTLVVAQDKDVRRLRSLPWGLPQGLFVTDRPREQRGTLFARESVDGRDGLIDSGTLTRCLIVAEAFAYPAGDAGQRVRSWAGLWDEPLCAWAGVCELGDESGFAGLLTASNALVGRVSRHMPILLRPKERDTWLAGVPLHAIDGVYEEAAWFLEPSDEAWSSGAYIYKPDDRG